jgi:hypothetical protein
MLSTAEWIDMRIFITTAERLTLANKTTTNKHHHVATSFLLSVPVINRLFHLVVVVV